MRDKNDKIICVVGHERSGTSLLRAILEAHGGFSIPPNDADIFSFFEKNGNASFFSKIKLNELAQHPKLLSWLIDWKKVESNFTGDQIDSQELFKIILESFWAKSPEKIKAFKRPKYEHRIHQLKKIFPNSRFIALLRDPRAVLASKKYYGGQLGSNWNLGNIVYIRLLTSLQRWKNSAECIRYAEKTLGKEHVIVVSYEMLIKEPKNILQRIFAFTGDAYDEGKIFQTVKNSFNTNSTFLGESKSGQTFRIDAIDRWKEKLSSVELWLIEKTLGRIMEEEGMKLSNPQISLFQHLICMINLALFVVISIIRKSNHLN